MRAEQKRGQSGAEQEGVYRLPDGSRNGDLGRAVCPLCKRRMRWYRTLGGYFCPVWSHAADQLAGKGGRS